MSLSFLNMPVTSQYFGIFFSIFPKNFQKCEEYVFLHRLS